VPANLSIEELDDLLDVAACDGGDRLGAEERGEPLAVASAVLAHRREPLGRT